MENIEENVEDVGLIPTNIAATDSSLLITEDVEDIETGGDTSEDIDVKAIRVTTGDAVRMSAISFNNSPTTTIRKSLKSANTTGTTTGQSTDISPGRKVNADDIRNVFRASTTTGNVSMEQIIRIKRMHDKIDEGVVNYTVLIMVASIVAGIGLAIDSATTVISSMLLSLIMGPVLGMAYGLIIQDVPLIKQSMKNEILSILLCIVLSLIIGACCSWTDMAKDWPSAEMLTRGTPTTLFAGIAIAFFSGLGVALSVIDDQTSSLVGVAISASLLPPAVNCGMLWVMAIIKDESWKSFSFKILYNEESFEKAILKDDDAYHYYGLLSLLLTIANVIAVAVGAAGMFRLKEVLPVKKKIFWDDLKVARRIYTGRATDEATGDMVSAERALIMATSADETEIGGPALGRCDI